MTTLLMARLSECCGNDPTLEPLLAQWVFDKKLISKALQSVTALFSHYSRHDESHSTQILINIERVLGPHRIARLSGTNVWLLLESAYYHDIGMVVTYEQKQADWHSESFHKFVLAQKRRASKDDRELYDAILDSSSGNLFRKEIHPLHYINLMSQLLAEYYRSRHAMRAPKIVSEPDTSIG